MKIKKIGLLGAALFLMAARIRADELSPLFKIGHPVWRSFSTTATGYGALGEDRSHVAVYVSLGESRLLKTGANADVRLGAPEGLVVSVVGRVTSVLADADPSTGQSIVSIEIPIQQQAARTYASAAIEINERRALAIPPSALIISAGQPFVFRQKVGNDFEKISVTLGEQLPDAIEIKSGLKQTDPILVEGAVEWAYKDAASGD